jgi:hypothetical protein
VVGIQGGEGRVSYFCVYCVDSLRCGEVRCYDTSLKNRVIISDLGSGVVKKRLEEKISYF